MLRLLRFLADWHLAIGDGLNLVADRFEDYMPGVDIYPPVDEYVGHHTVVA